MQLLPFPQRRQPPTREARASPSATGDLDGMRSAKSQRVLVIYVFLFNRAEFVPEVENHGDAATHPNDDAHQKEQAIDQQSDQQRNDQSDCYQQCSGAAQEVLGLLWPETVQHEEILRH